MDVETALDSVTSLPQDSEDPTIIRGRWSDRVTDVVISGPVAVGQLGLFADEFVMRLFTAGVTRTTMRGLAAPETVVAVPTSNLIMHDITMQEIAMAISEEVSADPAGDVDGANARVRTGVEKRLAKDIGSIVLRSNSDGSKLTIADVAELNVNGIDILLCKHAGKYYAIDYFCNHAFLPLEGGSMQQGFIACPYHGAEFSLADGSAQTAPAWEALRREGLARDRSPGRLASVHEF